MPVPGASVTNRTSYRPSRVDRPQVEAADALNVRVRQRARRRGRRRGPAPRVPRPRRSRRPGRPKSAVSVSTRQNPTCVPPARRVAERDRVRDRGLHDARGCRRSSRTRAARRAACRDPAGPCRATTYPSPRRRSNAASLAVAARDRHPPVAAEGAARDLDAGRLLTALVLGEVDEADDPVDVVLGRRPRAISCVAAQVAARRSPRGSGRARRRAAASPGRSGPAAARPRRGA